MLSLDVTSAMCESLGPTFFVRQDIEHRLGERRRIVGTKEATLAVDGLMRLEPSALIWRRQNLSPNSDPAGE